MTLHPDGQPLVALIDDDVHSARLLVRTLARLGARRVRWYGGAARGLRVLAPRFLNDADNSPALVVVDLKAHSAAAADFLRDFAAALPGQDVPVIVMARSLERDCRDALLAAGAAAVFARHSDIGAYQAEVTAMVDFLDRQLLARDLTTLGRRPAARAAETAATAGAEAFPMTGTG